jgi:hypothetical protein
MCCVWLESSLRLLCRLRALIEDDATSGPEAIATFEGVHA